VNQHPNEAAQDQGAPRQWSTEGDLTGFLEGNIGDQRQVPQGNPAQPNSGGYGQQSGQSYQSQSMPQGQTHGTHQPQPLPEIEIPEGYALAGRYRSLKDLEDHAKHFQSEHDKLRNQAQEAMELKQVLDQRPELYEVLAGAIEDPSSVGNQKQKVTMEDVIATDEFGNQRVDPAKLQEAMAAQVNSLVQQQVQAYVQPIQQQMTQSQEQAMLQQHYQKQGLSPDELEADLNFAGQIAQMSSEEKLELARQMRLARQQTSQQPGNVQPQQPHQVVPQGTYPGQGIPRSVASLGGYRPAPMTQEERTTNNIVAQGKRSFGELFKS
jgi:hypothetical protein